MRGQGRPALVLLAPFFVVFVAAMLVPLGYTLFLSLFTWQAHGLGFSPPERVFVGIENYARAFGSPQLQDGLVIIGLYCAISVPVMIVLAVLLALLLDSRSVRAPRLGQLLLFLPHAVPDIIAALLWAYLYLPGISPIVRLLASAEIHVDFLSRELILPAIINIALWMWTGYNMVIFYTALKAVPPETIEAASVDGANGLQIALRIKLPLLRPAVVLVLLFSVIGALQLFNSPTLMRTITSSVNSTYTPAMFIYDAAFASHDSGLAAAASIVLAGIAAALSWIVTRSSRPRAAARDTARSARRRRP